MSESATLVVKNNSGRNIDSIAMWHSALPPDPTSGIGNPLFVQGLVNQDQITVPVPLTSGAPLDYWYGGVLFHGDGTTYVITGVTGEPYKEYEVSNGSTITFVVNQYTTNTTSQSDMTVQYSGDGGGTAGLLNPTISLIDSAMIEIAQEIVTHTAV